MTRSRGVRPVERKPPKDQSSRGNSTQPHFSCLPPHFCPNRRTILLACRNIRFGCLRGQFVRSCSGLLSQPRQSSFIFLQFVSCWCPREDSDPHAVASTRPCTQLATKAPPV